jgi:hypothetical protein
MRLRFGVGISILLAVSCAVLLESFQPEQVEPIPIATYSRGVVHVALPYRAPHSGPGQLRI